MQMEGTPILIILWGLFVLQKMTEKDQIIQFSTLCKISEECLLLKSLLGGIISELLRRFSHQSTAQRI